MDACHAATRRESARAAGAAHALLATDVTAGERELLAQKIDQCLACIDTFANVLAIHGDRDLVEALAHEAARPSCRATRRSSTPARCVFTAPEACMSSGGSLSSASALTPASPSPSSWTPS